MSASLQRNIIPQDIAGYIELADELKAFLKAEYPQVPEAEFQVKNINDRWVFKAPEQVSEEKLIALVASKKNVSA